MNSDQAKRHSKQAEAEAVIHSLHERLAQLEEENLLLEEVLQRNSRMFEALISNAHDGITLTGPDRRIVRVIKGLTGIDPSILTGHLIDSLAAPDDRPTIERAYAQLLQTRGGKVGIKIQVLQKDGGMSLYNATLSDMLDDPNVQGIVWNYSKQLQPDPTGCTEAACAYDAVNGEEVVNGEDNRRPRESSLLSPA